MTIHPRTFELQCDDDLGLWPVAPAAPRPTELTVVAPTFNEAGNLIRLIACVSSALEGVAWELIVVDDDSPDGTARLARRCYGLDGRVRVLRRIGRRGLAGACIEGWLASSSPYLAVMDADGQHDAALLPAMLAKLKGGSADVVVASRYADGGDVSGWSHSRRLVSRAATGLARLAGAGTTDPMSGFFALRRELFEARAKRLSDSGFKILLDLLLTRAGPRLRIAEIPFSFGARSHGRSKFALPVAWDCLSLVIERASRGLVPRQALTFGCVGALGVAVHLAVVSATFSGMQWPFEAADAAAIGCAIAFNYALNNVLTFADRSNRGWRWWTGLLSFGLICGSGAFANLKAAELVFAEGSPWTAAAAAGAAVGAGWNYLVSSRFTWRRG